MNCPISGVDLSHTPCGWDEPDAVHKHHHPTFSPGLVLSCCKVSSSAVEQLCDSCCLFCLLLRSVPGHGIRNGPQGSTRTKERSLHSKIQAQGSPLRLEYVP